LAGVIVLDASVLIAYLAEDDPHHQRSRRILAADDQFMAHSITLAEAFVKGERENRLDEVAEAFEGLAIAEADRMGHEPRRLARLRVQTGLKIPDCCVLMLADAQDAVQANAFLATFDARLAQVARQRGIVVLDGSQ
jgi:predicted nucleic acid-binding protein